MPQLKKLFFKKKARSLESLSASSLSGVGYGKIKEKDLPKLLKAAWLGDLAKVKSITSKAGKKSEDINQLDKQNRTALHLACARGHAPILRHLLDRRAKATLCDNEGKTALIKAVECQEKECVEVLLEHEADPNAVDRVGRTALHICAEYGQTDLGGVLLERGARIDVQDKEGRTALHVVSKGQHNDFAALLLQEGAPVDAVDNGGQTPLIIAANSGFVALVRLLTDHKADARLKDAQGYAAADYALMKGHTHVSEILRGQESQGLSAAGSRRPSAAGSQRSGLIAVGLAPAGITFGAPAVDRGEEPSIQTGEDLSRDDSRASPRSWMSSDEDSFHVDIAPKKNPNVASQFFSNGHSVVKETGLLRKDASSLEVKKKPKPWESVDVDGSFDSEEEKEVAGRWTQTATSAALLAQASPTAVQDKPGDDFESEEDDIDAQVNAALMGKAIREEEKKPPTTLPAIFAKPADQRRISTAGQGLGINYGAADNESVASSLPFSDEDEDEDAVAGVLNRFNQKQSQNSGSGNAETSQLQKKTIIVVDKKEEQKTTVDDKEGRGNVTATVTEENKSKTETDDDWDSDDEDIDDDVAASNALAGLGGGSLSTALHTRFFQTENNEDSEDDIEMMAAPQKNLQPKAGSPKQPFETVSPSLPEPAKRTFGSIMGPVDDDDDDEEEEEEEDDFESDGSLVGDKGDEKVKSVGRSDEKPEKVIYHPPEGDSQANDDTFTEESRSEWEEEEKRQRQIKEQKVQRQEEAMMTLQKTEEWQKENAEAELQRLEEAEELKRAEKREVDSWDESSVVEESLADGMGSVSVSSERSLQSEDISPVREVSVQLRTISDLQSSSGFLDLDLNSAVAKAGKLKGEKDVADGVGYAGRAMMDVNKVRREEEERRVKLEKEEKERERQRIEREKEVRRQAEVEEKRQKEVKRLAEVEEERRRMEREKEVKRLAEVEEERRRIEKEKEVKRLAEVEEERRRQEEAEGKAKIAEEEAKLAEVRKLKEMERLKREGELKERAEKEEKEMKRRLEGEERMAAEAKQRRLAEEARVKEVEERVKKRQEELKKMEEESKRRREEEEAKWCEEQEANQKEQLRLMEEESKRRLAEEKKWAAEQEKQRREQAAKIEEDIRRRKQEQERAFREEQERRRLAEVKRLKEEKQLHEEEMRFWRAEQEKRTKETEERLARAKEREEGLRKLQGGSLQAKLNRDEELDDALGLNSRGLPSGAEVKEDSGSHFSADDSYSDSKQKQGEVFGDENEDDESLSSLRSTVLSLDAVQKAQPQALQSSSRHSFMASSPYLLSDTHMASRLNETLRETKKMLSKANDARSVSEISQREMKAELLDFQRRYDGVAKAKSSLDQARLDLELEVRSLRYKYEQEQAVQQSTTMLLSQVKEQLARAETRLNQESQARREAELGRRNAEIEQRTVQSGIHQLDSQITELKLQLVKERDVRAHKEESYVDQMKLYKELQEEARKAVDQKAFAQNGLQSSSDRCRELQGLLNSAQAELLVMKDASESSRRQYEERVILAENELEALKERLQDKTEEMLNLEKALMERKYQFDGNLGDLKSKIALLDVALDKERGLKEAVALEARSLKNRLDSASQDLEQALAVNRDMEKTYHREYEVWAQSKSSMEKELSQVKETAQRSALQVATLQAKLETSEKELQNVQLQLAERVGQLTVHGKDSESRDKQLVILEEKARQDRVACSQLNAKLEMTSEKLTTYQSECTFLKQQLDLANSKIAERDRAAQEGQDKFTTLINSLRMDNEKAKMAGDAKQEELLQQVVQLKEGLARSEAEKKGLDRDVRRLQDEIRDGVRRQDVSAGSLERVSELKSTLEGSKSALERKVVELATKLEKAHSELKFSQEKMSDLSEQLMASESSEKELVQKLQSLNEEFLLLNQAKADVERQFEAAGGDRRRLELNLTSDREKVSGLRDDLLKAEQFRNRLEAKCSDLRHEVNELEEQLKEAKAAHSLALSEAEEAKGLWESEVKSRSKLGMRLLQLEKNQTDIRSTVDSEKKRSQKALDLKRTADYKVDALQERNTQLQQELGMIRGQLKASKKRLKNVEISESRVPVLKAEFQGERAALESNINALKTQLDDTRRQLVEEAEWRSRKESTHSRLSEEIKALKSEAMVRDAKEREQALVRKELQKTNNEIEDELRRIKSIVSADYLPKRDVEEYKEAIDTEGRLEFNRRLEELNARLAKQSSAQESLDRMRDKQDAKMREEFERTSSGLKTELLKLRNSLHDSQVQKESAESEAKRYKTLFEREIHGRESVGSDLQHARREKSHSRGKLHSERRRMRRLLDSTADKDDIGKGRPPIFSTVQKSDDLLASVRAELDRSVRKHLDATPLADTTSASFAAPLTVGDLGGSTAGSSSRYLAELKRNYFV